jgi:hypothetical protein
LEFIDPFFKALVWYIHNKKGVAEAQSGILVAGIQRKWVTGCD